MNSISIEIVFTLLLNALPIIIMVIPWIFIRKKAFGKLYFRIMMGIIIFYLIYWVLPIIFQFNKAPDELGLSSNEETLSLSYILIHFSSLIMQFIQYPLITLPFIFFLAPIITFLIVLNRLRKEEGSVSDNLQKISYDYKKSPFRQIKDELLNGGWVREKEILKVIVVLLPISLYLLQVILKITGLEAYSLQNSETALGWFLEILFAYLAVLIFAIELLSSSKLSLKGRYFGENIREQTYKSLYIVGLPISVLSIILFLVDNRTSIDIIFYFLAYSLMGSVIFILFLKIFEPISVLILIKLIDWWKRKRENINKINKNNFYYGIVFGLIAVFGYIIVTYFSFNILYSIYFPEGEAYSNYLINQSLYDAVNPSLFDAASLDLMIIFNAIGTTLLPLIITTIVLLYCFRYTKSLSTGTSTFLIVIVTLSVLFSFIHFLPLINYAEEYWVTGRVSYTFLFDIRFFTLRTALLDARLEGILAFLAIPFLYGRMVFAILIWGLMAFYLSKKFRSKNIQIEEKVMEKIFYSTVRDYLTLEEYNEEKNRFLISKNLKGSKDALEHVREEVKTLMDNLSEQKLLNNLKPAGQKESERFYYTLKYLFKNNLILLWESEFSYTFEIVKKQGLYIIYDDGRGVYDYQFSKESETDQDAGLISGMFSAITSFVKETTKSTEALQKIDHGDITILIEYGDKIFGALFVKGDETSEVRYQLREFVRKFETNNKETLKDWSGALAPFQNTEKLVEEIFKSE